MIGPDRITMGGEELLAERRGKQVTVGGSTVELMNEHEADQLMHGINTVCNRLREKLREHWSVRECL